MSDRRPRADGRRVRCRSASRLARRVGDEFCPDLIRVESRDVLRAVHVVVYADRCNSDGLRGAHVLVRLATGVCSLFRREYGEHVPLAGDTVERTSVSGFEPDV